MSKNENEVGTALLKLPAAASSEQENGDDTSIELKVLKVHILMSLQSLFRLF